jgi:hypothetical protein
VGAPLAPILARRLATASLELSVVPLWAHSLRSTSNAAGSQAVAQAVLHIQSATAPHLFMNLTVTNITPLQSRIATVRGRLMSRTVITTTHPSILLSIPRTPSLVVDWASLPASTLPIGCAKGLERA